jgi:hypothetical protein
MKALNEALLDDKLGELEQLRTWTPRVISKLESFLRIDDDWALFRANPFTFAEERGVNEDEAVDLFLYASKVGIFQLTWNLLCPGCGAAVQSFATLRSVCAVFHCYLCATDIETRLDDYVHVGFTVSPKIRSIPGHESSTLTAEDYYFRYYFTRETRASAGGPPFLDTLRKMALGLRYVEPGQTATLEATLAPGALVMLDAITNATFVFLIDAASIESDGLSGVTTASSFGATRAGLEIWVRGEDREILRRVSDQLTDHQIFHVVAVCAHSKPFQCLTDSRKKYARA